MTKINLTPPNFEIAVGGLDITELVQQFSFRQAAISVDSPIVWEGSMAIAKTKLWTGESLDDWINPTRWARGKHPVIVTYAGVVFATLRIASYVYNEDLDSAEIQVTQLLSLLDYRTPPQDYRFISNSNLGESIQAIVTKLLTAAGVPSFSVSGYAESVSIPPPDRTNKSYIGLAQKILGERGYWLYHAEGEAVQIKQINQSATKSLERYRGQIVEYNRTSQRDSLANIYRVIGGGEKYQTRCGLSSSINRTEFIYGDSKTQSGYYYQGNFVPSTTIYGRKIVEKIVTELITDSPFLVSIKTTSYKDLKLVDDKKKEYNLTLRKVSETIDSSFYDSQGRLIRQLQTTNGLAYGRYPESRYDLYPFALTWLSELDKVETIYSHDPNVVSGYAGFPRQNYDTNVLRLRSKTTSQKFLNTAIFKVGTKEIKSYEFYLAPKEREIETWVENCFNNDEPTYGYQRKVYSRDPVYNYAKTLPSLLKTTELFLINELTDYEENSTPPNWSTRSALFPRVNAKLNAEVRRNYPGADDDLIDRREFEYSAESITTAAEAQRLANIFADLSVGRAFGYEIVLSLRESVELITDPTPLQVAWFHNRVFLLDSPSVVFDGKEAEIAWEGVTLQVLDPPVPTPVPPSFPDPPDATPIGLARGETIARLQFGATLVFADEVFNATEPPDFSLISVDVNGDVVTVNGYVQASVNQNQFSQLLVADDGTVIVSADGFILTTADDIYDPVIWNAIATINSEIVTVNGEVAWF